MPFHDLMLWILFHEPTVPLVTLFLIRAQEVSFNKLNGLINQQAAKQRIVVAVARNSSVHFLTQKQILLCTTHAARQELSPAVVSD